MAHDPRHKIIINEGAFAAIDEALSKMEAALARADRARKAFESTLEYAPHEAVEQAIAADRIMRGKCRGGTVDLRALEGYADELFALAEKAAESLD